MKAFLLAAGNGTRLRPITDRIPKCLVEIQGKPLLGIWFDLLRRYGVREILVNVHAHTITVREYVREHSQGLIVDILEEPELLGSAGTIVANRDWLGSEQDFLVLYADVLTNLNLEKMLRFHLTRRAAATLGVYAAMNPEQCGITVVDINGIVRQFVEKPRHPPCNLAFSGVLIGTPTLLDSIPARIPADLGFDVLPRLVNQMVAYRIKEFLLDIGTPENHRLAQLTWPGI